MSVTSALLSFAVVAGLVTIVPGLDTALVIRATVADGRRAGFGAALGVGAGCLAWGIAAAAGVAALLTASKVAGTTLRVAGAAYLVWLGGRMLLAAVRRGGPAGLADGVAAGGAAEAGVRGPWAAAGAWWWRGFVTNVLNPKIGAFYVAVIPQFLADGVPPAVMGVLLALVHDLEGIVWFTAIILGVARVRRLFVRPAFARGMDAVTGTALVGFGVALAREAAQ